MQTRYATILTLAFVSAVLFVPASGRGNNGQPAFCSNGSGPDNVYLITSQTIKDDRLEIYPRDTTAKILQNLAENSPHDYLLAWVPPDNFSASISEENKNLSPSTLELHILYDDNQINDRVMGARGFSCLIRGIGSTILMDTGGDGGILLHNMTSLNVTPEEIDIVVISHCNSDHIGGLPAVLKNSRMPKSVYLPGGNLPGNLGGRALDIIPAKIDSARSIGADIIKVYSPPEICNGIRSTGVLGEYIPEQSLIILTQRWAVVVTGCAHPGVARIVRLAADMTGQPLLLLIGGFHLVNQSAEALDRLAADLESHVKFIAPCHCSGDLARKQFKLCFGDRCLLPGAGSVIRIADLDHSMSKGD